MTLARSTSDDGSRLHSDQAGSFDVLFFSRSLIKTIPLCPLPFAFRKRIIPVRNYKTETPAADSPVAEAAQDSQEEAGQDSPDASSEASKETSFV